MKGKDLCCCGKFPTFPVVILLIGILWLLADLKIITVDIPWVPIVIIVVAIGWIANVYMKKE